jgi:hypothetical protein
MQDPGVRWACVGISEMSGEGSACAVVLDAADPDAVLRPRGDWGLYEPGKASAAELIRRYSWESRGFMSRLSDEERRSWFPQLIGARETASLGPVFMRRVLRGWALEVGCKWTSVEPGVAFQFLMMDLAEMLGSCVSLLIVDIAAGRPELERLLAAPMPRGLLLFTRGDEGAAAGLDPPPGVLWTHFHGQGGFFHYSECRTRAALE